MIYVINIIAALIGGAIGTCIYKFWLSKKKEDGQLYIVVDKETEQVLDMHIKFNYKLYGDPFMNKLIKVNCYHIDVSELDALMDDIRKK